MFVELLQAEVWRKKLETSGFKVILEPWDRPREHQKEEKEDKKKVHAHSVP